MTHLIPIMIVVFSVLLVILLAVLFLHPRFPEREQAPSLLNRESYDDDPESSYDHQQLFPQLKARFSDIGLFMQEEVMKEGILLHWLQAHDNAAKVLFDVTDENTANDLLLAAQRMHWHHGTARFDFYVLVRFNERAQKETDRYFCRLMQEKIPGLDVIVREGRGLAEYEGMTFALIGEERWPSIDFALECDEQMCQEILGRYRKAVPLHASGTEKNRIRTLKKELPEAIRRNVNSDEKLIEKLPFAEVWLRPQAERNGTVIRLRAVSDDELEKGISVLADILQKADLTYGIARQNRSRQTMQETCRFPDLLKDILRRQHNLIPVDFGDEMLEGWPGFNTISFSPVFRNGETGKETVTAFWRRLLEKEE